MRKIGFISLGVVFLWGCCFSLSASNDWKYAYYLPHVVVGGEFYSASHGQTVFMIVIAEDGTSYELDQDADGIYEIQETALPAGTYHYYYRSNWPSPTGILETGGSVRSDKPMQVILNYLHNNFGTYDSGFFWTSLYPSISWGAEFVVPVSSTYQYVFAKDPSAVIVTKPGQPSASYSMPALSDQKFTGLPPGTRIEADNPIYVIAVNCQPDENYPWMCNVMPTSMIGKEYFHDTTYGPHDITSPIPTIPKLWLTAVKDNTVIELDENHDGIPELNFALNASEYVDISPPADGTHISANKDFYIVNEEIWAVPHNGKYGGIATEYLPVKYFGKEFAILDDQWDRLLPDQNPRIFIVAAEYGTTVNVDFGWDGVDVAGSLNKGEVLDVFWPENFLYTAHVWSNKKVQVIFRTDKAHWDHPGVCVGYTAMPMDVDMSPVKEITIDIKPGSFPNSINPNSNGKIPVAVLTTEDFDCAVLDPESILFGPNGSEAAPSHYAYEDVDYDGDIDMILHFKTQQTQIKCGDTEVKLTGQTFSGLKVAGIDSIRTVGCK